MKLFVLVFACLIGSSISQNVNNVHIWGHIPYMISVLQEVVSELEHREWCNLKVPDIQVYLNTTVFERHYEGTVRYTNGFVTSIQWVDIRQQGVDQNWSWNATDETGTVHIRGTLRLLDVQLGYDVIADFEDGHHRYTMGITYPLTLFTFNIWRNVNTLDVRVEVVGAISTSATISRISFMPNDPTSDVLTTLFNLREPEQGILAWADEVFTDLVLEAYHKLEFPDICYDCPLATTMI